MTFNGFDDRTFRFLKQLKKNNNREWFQENKPRYESDVMDVAFDFIVAMSDVLARISPHFEAIPKRSGGSLMRVYRDTRFGKDKTPYKTNIGIQFRHHAGKDVHAPGYYLHIADDECFAGVGMWRPEPGALRSIREAIAEQPGQWKKASRRKAFLTEFELQGESLKRPPKGFSPDEPWIDDLKRKDFIAVASLSKEQVADPDLPKHMLSLYRTSRDYMAFLCRAVDVPFK